MTAVRLRLLAELRSRWRAWTTFALLVGVAGGVVLLTAAGARRTNSSYSRYLTASRASDLLVAPVLSAYDAALVRLPGIEAIAHAAILNPVDKKRQPTTYAVIGPGAGFADAIDRPKVASGRMFRPDDPGEAVVDTRMAAKSHVGTGSRLALSLAPQSPGRRTGLLHFEIRIVGIVVTRNDAISVSTNDAFPQVLVSPALVRRLDANYGLNYVVVRIRPGYSPTSVAHAARRLAQHYPAIANEIQIANESDQAARIEQAIRPQAAALAIFALLAALAALVVLGQVAARDLFVSSVEFPTLRAIGSTRAQLLATLLLEVAIAAILGAAIAVALALVASPLVLFGPARISEPHPGLAADWTVLGIGAAGIVVLLVLRVAWSAWRLSRATPDWQRTGTGAPVVRSSRIAREAAQLGAPVTATIGVRLALEPGRGRTAVPVRSALVGSVIAIASVAAAFTFGSNLVHLVRTPGLYGQTWDATIDAQFASPPTRVYVNLMANHAGVDRWSFGDYATLQVGTHTIPAIGILSGRGAPLLPTVLEGRAPRVEDEVALGGRTLSQLNARIGDTIEASLAGHTIKLRVVGRVVLPAFGQGDFNPTGLGDGALLPGPLVARFAPPRDAGGARPGTANFALVHVAGGAQHTSDVNHLLTAVAHNKYCIRGLWTIMTAQRPADIRNYARVESTPLALAALLALLAIASIGHALVTAIRRRRRDLAILMTLGFTRRQISAAIAWQATTLAFVTLAIGLPLGAIAGRSIWTAFSAHLDVAPSVHIPLVPILLTIPSAFAIAILLAAGPAWIARRRHPGDLLRAE